MRFIRDHGIISAVIVGVVTIVAALIGTDRINVHVSTNISGSAASAPDEPSNPSRATPSRKPASVPLTDLADAGEATHLDGYDDGDYGTQSIGGDLFEDGASMIVYPEGGGFPEVDVMVKGRFGRVTGVVGIDGDAECIQTPAEVSIIDDLDNVLWGPVEVDSRSQVRFSVDISDVVRISLSQRSLGRTSDRCGEGVANPAWGEVLFEEAA